MSKNKAKKNALDSQQTDTEVNIGIPSGKPVRMGNFRIWKSIYVVGKGSAEANIDCINVSNLDGTWHVRIPQTFEMFGMLTVAYQWSKSEDAEERSRGEDFIRTVLSNMTYVSCICNGFYHHAIEMVTSAYATPSLLQDTEEGKGFMLDVKGTMERFLAWRKEYEKYVSANQPTEQDLRQEDIAEEAMEILSGNENK